jgi:DNA-binding phage protein
MSRLAKMTDMPSSTIYRAFASDLESARLLTIKKIADALGLSIDEMLCE